MSRIRVVHCIGSLNRGGAQRQLRLLLSRLDRERYEQAVVFFREDVWGECASPVAGPDATEERWEKVRIPRGARWALHRVLSGVHREIVRCRPDLVHLWLPEILTVPAALSARRHGIPVVSSQRGRVTSARHLLRYGTHLLATRIVTNVPIRADGPLFRRLFALKGGAIIPNALDRQAIDRVEAQPLPGVGRPTLIFAGRLVPTKRIDLALRVVAALHERDVSCSLLLCGAGSEDHEGALRALATQLGIEGHVLFLGHRPDWIGLAKSADLFVFPSVSEGMPNALLEASAAGLPIVAADIPGVRAVYTHGRDAMLCPPGECAPLADAVARLLEDTHGLARLAAAGRQLVERFSAERMCRAYEALYSECVRKTTAPGAVATGVTR